MKKRRALILTLLTLLLMFGIPMVLTIRAVHHEQANRDLIAAIKADDTPAALAALHAGADANATDFGDRAPSMREVLQRFWNHLIHPSARQEPEFHRTALLILLGEHPVDDRGNKETEPSYWQVKNDKEDRDGSHETVTCVENFSLLKTLVEKGADVNARDEYDDTPLLLAARWDHRASMRLLIQHGADVRSKNQQGYTALDWAAINGNIEGVQELLLKGAEVNLRDSQGNTVLDHNKSGYERQRQGLAGAFLAAKWSARELASAGRKIMTQGQYEAILDQDRKSVV